MCGPGGHARWPRSGHIPPTDGMCGKRGKRRDSTSIVPISNDDSGKWPQGAPSLYIKVLMNLVLRSPSQDSDELNGDMEAQTAIVGSLTRWEP